MLLVVDVGTSSMRGVVFDRYGRERIVKQIPYEVRCFDQIYVEQDAAVLVSALRNCCAAAAAYSWNAGESLTAAAFASQRSSLIPVDRKGNPLCPAIMWQDTRNQQIVEEFQPYEELLIQKTGARLNTVYSATKMTWFRRNSPDLYKKTDKLCTIADYLNHEMTNEWALDETYVCRSLLGDLRTCRWDPELLSLFEVEVEKLSSIIPPGSVSGHVSASFAEDTGLPAGLPVISSGGDQQCSALGLGAVNSGDLTVTAGTGAFLAIPVEQLPKGISGDIVLERHALPGKYLLESSVPACASLYNWANRMFYGGSQQDIERINHAIERTPAGANGCMVLPYFQGRGTPDWNADAKGSILNLTLASTADDISRAILESIAYEIANNLDVLGKYTALPEQIRLDGGLARFDVFAQILADTCQRTVCRSVEMREHTAFGGFLSAAAAAGLYDSAEEAYQAVTQTSEIKRYKPNAEVGRIHAARRQELKEVYLQMTACRRMP